MRGHARPLTIDHTHVEYYGFHMASSRARDVVGSELGKRPKLREKECDGEDETQREALEMIPPPLKRFCSTVVPGVRKIAVESNIGEFFIVSLLLS